MQYVLAVFRSRNVSTRVYNYLVAQGVTCALVSTPKNANVGCGLSVKMGVESYNAFGVQLSSLESFVAFFLVKLTLNGSVMTRL